MNHVFILDDVRSVHNVGSLFRLADCAGISKLYLCGVTPAPLDRFGRVRSDMQKVALGAEKTVGWESGSLTKVLNTLKKEGFTIVALEQDAKSVDYKKVQKLLADAGTKKVAFWFGNEPYGILKKNLKKADVIMEIPLKGNKESLNVVQAAAIAVFRVLNI